jgi:hypothetical protein
VVQRKNFENYGGLACLPAAWFVVTCVRACVPGSGAGAGRCSEPVCPMANDLYEQAGRQHRDRADGLKGALERAVTSVLPVVVRY